MKAHINIEGEGWTFVSIISITPQGSRYIILYFDKTSISPKKYETYNLTDIEVCDEIFS